MVVYEGREFKDETWGMDVRAGATLRRNVDLCPAVAFCDSIVVPGLRIHRTDSLVARGVDVVLSAACPPLRPRSGTREAKRVRSLLPRTAHAGPQGGQQLAASAD